MDGTGGFTLSYVRVTSFGAASWQTRLEPGYRLDRYELLCPIAQGGMASVWLARLHGKHGFEKLVAVKTILPQYALDLQFQKMFLDEARIAAGIEHSNVAQILDLGEQNEVLYLVMEWVDGDSLSRLFRAVERAGERIPLGILGRIVADMCGGLHAAHELRGKDGSLLGVVHRDVSPQNLLVSVGGTAKLIDFGIAKARDRVGGETSAGNIKGKILYMAPEQALGGRVDRRADVWAVGALLYHLLSGKPPYEGENQLATLHLLATAEPTAPLPASVPKAVADVVMGALVHDPEHRIATAAEFQRRLEAALVATSSVASTADVAAFVRARLGDRAEQRHQAVDLALEAAADRARVEATMQPAASDSSSGVKPAFVAPQPQPSGPHLPASLSSPEPFESASGATPSAASLVAPATLSDDAQRRRMMLLVASTAAAASLLLGVLVLVAISAHGANPAKPAATAASAIQAPAPPAAAETRAAREPTTNVAPPVASEHTVAPLPSPLPAPESHPVAAANKPLATANKPVATAKTTKPAHSASSEPKAVNDGF